MLSVVAPVYEPLNKLDHQMALKVDKK
jgi:hypothetical protein